jgi:multidrug efflux system outer membrane protein
MTARRTSALLLASAALTGCSMAPHYQRPDAALPPAWPTGAAYPTSGDAALPSYTWRQVMTDPRLQRIISQALAHNQDVAAALAAIAEARANYRIQRADLFPHLSASTAYSHSGGQAAVKPGDAFSAQGAIPAYELDLFGRVRSLTAAERNRYLSSIAGARAVRLSLIASIAQAWINYGADQSLLQVAQDTAANARTSVALTSRRVNGGIDPLDNQRKSEIILSAAEADIASQTTAQAQDANALRLLAGSEVATVDLPGSIEDAGTHLAEVPAGLDSSTLLRRPDVVQAEYTLKAANADIGAARAALFPTISLTALAGVASSALSSLFTAGAFSWSAGADATYSIFSAGKGRAGVALANAQRDAALAAYRKAIQAAFQDVADTLARRGTIDAQLGAVERNVFANRDNYRLADERYRGGIDSFLDSLTAQQSYYAAQKTLVATRLARASNLVELYRSLGAEDFRGDAVEPLPADPAPPKR